MQALLAVLSRSESFCEFWPKLAHSARAELAVGETISALQAVAEPFGIVVAGAGVEYSVIQDVEELRAKFLAPICVVGAASEHRLAISLLGAGADDYFSLPDDIGALRSWVIDRAERLVTTERVEALAAEHRRRYDFSRMIGESTCFTQALDRACKIIPHSGSTILIHGETGTGKELLARAIHYNGERATKPFVEVNCAALPEHLLESELFGYESGAFTDARSPKPGLFEVAHGGTLFLDEIGDLPLSLQGKILRVLEDKTIRRLGGLRNTAVDVRIMAATHVNLLSAVREGRFREDLFYRLNIVPIRLPPLRERGEDLLLLARHFLERFSEEYRRDGLYLTPEVRKALLGYTWPGNIRELRNVIERAVLLGDGALDPHDLFAGEERAPPPRGDGVLPFPASIREIEVAAAFAAVEQHGGNKTRAAATLQISRKYLYELLRDTGSAYAQR
jgi:transcriptional regulator with PAS, ATPase and Fis domain